MCQTMPALSLCGMTRQKQSCFLGIQCQILLSCAQKIMKSDGNETQTWQKTWNPLINATHRNTTQNPQTSKRNAATYATFNYPPAMIHHANPTCKCLQVGSRSLPCQKAPQMGTQWAPRKWMDMEMVYIWKPMSTVQVQACLESKLSAWMFSHWGQGATGRTGTVYLGGVAECCIKCQKPPLKATLRCIFSGERVLQWSPMVGVSCIWNHLEPSKDNSRHI